MLSFKICLKRLLHKTTDNAGSTLRGGVNQKFVQTVYIQLTFTCSESTIETLEKGVKHVQS